MISSKPSVLPTIPADFPDWLGPMTVKELRQGLRSNFFLGIFLLLHLALFCWMFPSLLGGDNRIELDVLFWIMISGSLGLLSLRGLGAVYLERKKGTLELLQLCVPSLWEILWGKWISLLLQILIVAASLLPYLVIRYFIGQFDLLLNLQVFLFLGCAVALVAALAQLASLLRRIGIIICTLLLVFLSPYLFSTLVFFLFVAAGLVYNPFISDPRMLLLLGDFFLLVYAVLLLALASGFSASPFDNAAVRLKSLGWLLLLPAFLLALAGAPQLTLFAAILAAPGLLLVFFFSAAMRSLRDPRLAEKIFAEWPRWRRWSARLLAPTLQATKHNNLLLLACALSLGALPFWVERLPWPPTPAALFFLGGSFLSFAFPTALAGISFHLFGGDRMTHLFLWSLLVFFGTAVGHWFAFYLPAAAGLLLLFPPGTLLRLALDQEFSPICIISLGLQSLFLLTCFFLRRRFPVKVPPPPPLPPNLPPPLPSA